MFLVLLFHCFALCLIVALYCMIACIGFPCIVLQRSVGVQRADTAIGHTTDSIGRFQFGRRVFEWGDKLEQLVGRKTLILIYCLHFAVPRPPYRFTQWLQSGRQSGFCWTRAGGKSWLGNLLQTNSTTCTHYTLFYILKRCFLDLYILFYCGIEGSRYGLVAVEQKPRLQRVVHGSGQFYNICPGRLNLGLNQ